MAYTIGSPRKQFSLFVLLLNLVWGGLFLGAYAWEKVNENEALMSLAAKEAEASFNKDLVYRRWAAAHGGLYVPATENSPPNPYLDHVESRDIISPTGESLTLVNPAYMIRQVYELSAEQYGVLGHITSLNPLRPENGPDEWEKRALLAFENGEHEISEVTDIKGKPYLRYMQRVVTEQGCIKCHAIQAYQVGDVRGGISTSVPLTPYYKIAESKTATHAMVLFTIWISGMLLFNGGAILLDSQLKAREKIEKSLRFSEDSLQMAQEAADLGNWDWDMVNNTLKWSDKVFDQFGLSPGEIVPSYSAFKQFIHPEDRQKVLHGIEDAIRSDGSYSMDARMLKKDGTEWFMHTNGLVMHNENGEPIRFIGTQQDITQKKESEQRQKEMEAKLQQAYKMEAIGTLAGGIAHDFNNILGTIIGYTEMALDDCEPDSPISKDLDNVLEAGLRAAELVKQILVFSRQEQVEPIIFSPAVTIKEVLTMLRPTLPATITVKESIDPSAGAVLADPTKINQIFMNLCTNAYHAMEKEGGILEVVLQQLVHEEGDETNPHELQPGRYVQLKIVDTGVGIPEQIKDKIFDPYFTTKEIGRGSGMGLAIVHGYVQRYGGLVHFQSEPGVGTTFEVYLPIVEVEQQGLPLRPEQRIESGNETILFVDDEEMLVEMARDMLQRFGYHVIAVTSPLKALELFTQQPDKFDLIITDQTMPDITGAELATSCLKIRPDVPIILCTGFSSILTDEEAKAIGIKAFIHKPVVKKEIAGLIRNVIGDSTNREGTAS